MPIGTVKFFDQTRGFGFVIPDGATRRDENVFLPARALDEAGLDMLEAGDVIQFELCESRGRIAAGQLRLIERSPSQPVRFGD